MASAAVIRVNLMKTNLKFVMCRFAMPVCGAAWLGLAAACSPTNNDEKKSEPANAATSTSTSKATGNTTGNGDASASKGNGTEVYSSTDTRTATGTGTDQGGGDTTFTVEQAANGGATITTETQGDKRVNKGGGITVGTCNVPGRLYCLEYVLIRHDAAAEGQYQTSCAKQQGTYKAANACPTANTVGRCNMVVNGNGMNAIYYLFNAAAMKAACVSQQGIWK